MPRAERGRRLLAGVLPAATAPRRFLAGLERQCALPGSWRRAAAWIPALLAQPPRLCPAPLFGHSLAAVVQGGEERAETPAPRTAAAPRVMPSTPQGRRQRFATDQPERPQPGRDRDRQEYRTQSRSTPPGWPGAQERAPLPAMGTRRAGRSLLARLAGGSVAATKTPRPSARLDPPRSASAAGQQLPVPAETGQLIRHLAGSLRAGVFAPAFDPWPAKLSAAVEGPRPEGAADFGAQWASPLGGQQVSRDRLEALLQPATTRVPQPRPEGEDARRPERPATAPANRAGGNKTMAAGISRFSSNVQSLSETPPLRSPLRPRPTRAVEIDPGGERPSSAGTATEVKSRPPFPFVSAGGPAEAQGPTEFWPGPAGTPGERFFQNLRRQDSPRQDGFDRRPAPVPGAAEDDLEELSAKLQRILQEQARRHGIDV